ncbi:binding-protein-dependent transport system inner membrane protein [Pandoraea horticolens]|uniref:Binding-protein-dependent transport system inner membrane protein n=1 Tax=Pandoraea horticolens TaxID=2508298 RepID=A0A5E4URT0_9BURK|nr:ABC transporter permease [Pandoraea horticolens]VVE01719.1 binding-protein-dependent transport system inner membrane protein [Pandoraea horticolens]
MKAQVQRLVAARFGLALLTLLIVSAIVFTITALLPGDAAQMALGQAATPEAVTALRHQLGLDQPAITRYFQWLAHMFAGNFGDSMSNNLPVAQLIATRLPNSLVLAGLTTLVSVPLALGIGVAAAMWRGSLLDRALNVLTLAVVAVPEFLVATVAVLIFAVKLRWLPALSYLSSVNSFDDLLRIYAMPVMTLCCVIVAQMARMTRAAVIDQLSSSYVEMAVLKGASPIRVVWRHVLPNAVGPIANAVALSLSYLFGGVVIVESIFNYPGLASLLVDAVTNRDLPLVQGCVMVFCTAYLALVLIADLCAVVSNPRLRQR